MLKIGVTASFLPPDPNRRVYGKKRLLYLESDMSEYLLAHGALPVLIPEIRKPATRRLFLQQLDGVVFQGGDDIAPESYQQAPIKPEWQGDRKRDQYELAIMDDLFATKIPVFGICRGIQLINVFFGGTLTQDIVDCCGDKNDEASSQLPKHRDAQRYDRISHEVRFSKGGLLEKIYHNEPRRSVNSVHHQAIERIGDGLVIEAISPDDNIVEAVVYNGDPDRFILGVQWHPEFSHSLCDVVISATPLIETFLGKCTQKTC